MTNEEHHAYHAKMLNGKKWDVQMNSAWIEEFRKKHSAFMKENNPAQRHDITFELILNLCDMYGYNLYDLARRLDCSLPVIYRRISEKGFANFEQFATAYCSGWKNNGHNNSGNKNPRYDKSLTFQKICDAYRPGMKIKDILQDLETTAVKLGNRLHEAGYQRSEEHTSELQSHVRSRMPSSA